MGRDEELRAAGRLVGDALAATAGIAGEVHHAIARRVAGYLPAVAGPIAAVHETIAAAAYSAVSAGLQLASVAGAEVLAKTGRPGAPPLSETPMGRVALPAANGLWGDTLAERHPELALPMTVRVEGRDVPLDPAAVTAAFPSAGPRIAVFLHGLSLSEESWWRRGGGRRRTRSYGDRLRQDLGLTPVYVRYNTGLRIADNGRSLARLLEALAAAWPVPLRDIVLIGHSMGGLLARSACHQGTLDGAAWVTAVSAVVTLGTPHLGAPLEKGVHAADWLLSSLPETAPFARPLQTRSAGVRDLREGDVVDEGQLDVPFLDHAAYYFVAATLSRDATHPAGRLLGDGLVRLPSASGQGRTRRIPFDLGNGAHLGGLGHMALVNHPAVYRQLRAWLAGA
jgi:hypothetical protein